MRKDDDEHTANGDFRRRPDKWDSLRRSRRRGITGRNTGKPLIVSSTRDPRATGLGVLMSAEAVAADLRGDGIRETGKQLIILLPASQDGARSRTQLGLLALCPESRVCGAWDSTSAWLGAGGTTEPKPMRGGRRQHVASVRDEESLHASKKGARKIIKQYIIQ